MCLNTFFKVPIDLQSVIDSGRAFHSLRAAILIASSSKPLSLLQGTANCLETVEHNVRTLVLSWLLKNVLSDHPKIEFAVAMSSLEMVFWKRALHKYEHMYAYIPLYTYVKSCFPKHNLWIWHWHFKPIFLGWCLSRFGKELFKYGWEGVGSVGTWWVGSIIYRVDTALKKQIHP